MTAPKHNPEVYVKLAEANPFFSNKKIAELLGVDEASVRRAYKKAGYKRGLIATQQGVPAILETVDIPLHITGDCALMADVHNPLVDYMYVRTFLEDCAKHGIRKILFCGDFWHGDQYSNYVPKQVDLEDELSTGNELMAFIMSHFDRGYFIKGNHDYRYVKAQGYKMNFAAAMREAFAPLGDVVDVDKIEFSNLDHAYLHPSAPWFSDFKEKSWYVCHPQAYSRQPLAGARALTTIHGMNVATAHSHHCARGYGPNGKHQAVELGGFFDASRTAYLQASTAFPKWSQGYALYINGKMKLESPAWS